MKLNLRWITIPLFVVLITIFIVVFLRNHSRSGNVKVTQAPSTKAEVKKPIRPVAGAAAILPPDPKTLQKVPSHPMAASFGKSPDRATAEPSKLLEILQFYRQEFGTFPTGEDNASIMNALTGNNPSGLPIFPSNHPRISKDGYLLDAWGKPFFFHMISSQYIEVRSLGPDGIIFTEDDILVPKRSESSQAR